MNEEILILGLLVITAVSSSVAMIAAVAWWRAARRAQQFQDHFLQGGRPPDAADDESLLARVDNLTSRVEQLADGHHFLCRLLSRQRSLAPITPANGSLPARTPH
ncbi:MAG: hypothetical protein AB7L66_10825 [Gemmatimonadales bacterium]